MTKQITIGGKSYLLRLTNSGARLAQELLKRPFGQILKDLSFLDVEVIRVLLYACLRPEQPEMKLEAVDALMDEPGFHLLEISEPIGEAVAAYISGGSKPALVDTKKKARGSQQMVS